MYNGDKNMEINDYFKINNRMLLYRYKDLVSCSGVIEYQYFPLSITLNDSCSYNDNDYLRNLLLCDDIRNYSKEVIVDFSEMECSIIMDILNNLEDLYLNGDLDNVVFKFKYNRYLNGSSETYGTVSCDYKTIKETVLIVDMIIKYVEHFNLSKFERIMFVYDLLKERTYSEHIFSVLGIDDSKDKVLSEVLFDEAIVCLGYTNIMTAVLRGLGIDAEICNVMSKNSNDGHSVVVININDKKYNCDNRKLAFDITVDNKQVDDGWENRYNGFGLCSSQLGYLEKVLYFDCTGIKKMIDSEELDESVKLNLIANTRYIEHSIDAYKYGSMYAGDRRDFMNDNYLEYEKELDSELLSNLRKILSRKIDNKNSEEVLEMLREFLEDNPEYIDLLSDSLNGISGNYMDDTDYTKNPMIPENNRGGRK